MPSLYSLQRLLRLSIVFCSCTLPILALGDDWPTFRGADRTGVSHETGLLQEWPTEGPPLLWEARGVGRGYSSPVIADGRIYTLGDGLSTLKDKEDKDEYLICLDEKDGKEQWKAHTGTAWNQGKESWQSSRGTPTVDGALVYVVTPQGELFCFEARTGAPQWRKSFRGDFEGAKADSWGYSESVLIDGDRLICTPGGTVNTMVALNKKTGDVIWKVVRPEDRGAGHSSAVISEVGGTRVYVQSTGSGPMGVRASDGKLLWSYPIDRTTAVIPTPIVRDDLVFFVAGYGRGGALLRQIRSSDDSVTIDEVYGLKNDLANKHGGVVLVGDYLYGDSDDAGVPYCASLTTGEKAWKSRGSGKGSAAMLAADGRLYIEFANGTLVLAKADPKEYVEVSSFQVPGSGERPSWAHPVIAGGRLYLRENDRILCYDLRKR